MSIIQRFKPFVFKFGLILVLCFPLLLMSPYAFTQQSSSLTDEQIADILIKQSTPLAYLGNCPCRYSLDMSGEPCGQNSKYSQGGVSAPLCYRSDVTPDMIDDYRRNLKQ